MNRRNEKAITLIALVVTIVVLLILAGVSISMLTGENGIIKQAQDAKKNNQESEIEEQVRLAVMAAKAAGLGDIDLDELNSELDKIGYEGEDIKTLPADIEIDGVTIKLNADGNIIETIQGKKYKTETTITVGDASVTVPGGATISGIHGEFENVDNGIVAYIIPEGEPEITDWEADSDGNGIIDVQEKYDQFVWVPVENAVLDLSQNATAVSTEGNIKAAVQGEIDAGRYPMAIKKDETNYFGVLYEFSLDTSDTENPVVRVVPYGDWTPLCESRTYKREPAYLSDTNSADGSSNNNVGITQNPDSLQAQFNEMVVKVNDNKGFWVGRYETSSMVSDSTQDATSKIEVIKGTKTGIGDVNWYRMYAQQKNYSNLANISSTSSMIWGSQWDQIMIWMRNVKNTSKNSYYVVNALTMGNFGTSDDSYESVSETGIYDVKNIYDLAGNVYEWSIEADGTGFRNIRRRRYCGNECFCYKSCFS